MNNLTATALDKCSSLRSIVLICLALIATHVFYRMSAPSERDLSVEPRHCGKLPGALSEVSLKPVAMEQAADRLPIGAHLISPRSFYLHHGIYLGGGEVAHYAGFSGSFRAGPVEVTDLATFAKGRPLWIVQDPCAFSREEIVSRARSRLGENRYRILFNNCEHFCAWCVSGESYSAQVDAFLHRPRDLFALMTALQSRLIA